MIVLTHLDLQTLAKAPVAGLVNSAFVGGGIALLAWMLLRCSGRRNSGTRFAVWFFALLSIAALPFLGRTGLAPSPAGAPLTLSSSWAVYALAAWATISTLLLLRLGIGIVQIFRLRQGCEDVDPQTLDPQLRDVIAEFGPGRRVKLCVSGEVKAPAAIGFFRPAIVVPAWALTDLSVDELRVTLLHELAHLRRWDDWTNLVQKVVKAVFFFHPAVWWIDGKLALEREMACDDLVLEQTANPRVYAASLISFAEKVHRGRELALVHAVVGKVKQISQRVTRILDARRPRATRIWKPVMALVTVMSGAALVAAPYAPQLVAFEAPASSQAASVEDVAPVSTQAKVVPVSLKSSSVPQVKAVAVTARRETRRTVVPAKLKLRPAQKPRVMMARAVPQEVPPPDMTMVMQSVQYDEAGAQVVTLCIWRVTAGKQGQRQLEATFVVTKI